MLPPAFCSTPADLVASLPIVDPSRVEVARALGASRPIAYALGSGESDEVALYAGIKPLLRQIVAPAMIKPTRQRFAALGLAVEEAEHLVALPSTQGRVLFVARDWDRARAAAACEAAEDHDLELGQLLGYPRCCVDAYLHVPPPRSNAAAFARARASTGRRFEPRLNTLDLAVFHYLSWLPCSFSCRFALAFADAVAEHIAKRHGQFLASPEAARAGRVPRSTCPPGCRHETFVRDIDGALAAHRLLLLEDVQVSIEGVFDGHSVAVRRAWPTARDRHPHATLEAAALEAAARLAAIIEAAGNVAVEDRTLVVGGRAIARTENAMLLPFGGSSPHGARNRVTP